VRSKLILIPKSLYIINNTKALKHQTFIKHMKYIISVDNEPGHIRRITKGGTQYTLTRSHAKQFSAVAACFTSYMITRETGNTARKEPANELERSLS